MEEIFALEINARATQMGREARSKLQWRRTTGEVFQEISEFSLKARVGFCVFVSALEFEQRHHQSFGHVAAAVRADTSGSECSQSELEALEAVYPVAIT